MGSFTTRLAGYILLVLSLVANIPERGGNSGLGPHTHVLSWRSNLALAVDVTTPDTGTTEEVLRREERDLSGTEETPTCYLPCYNGTCQLNGTESYCVCDSGFAADINETECIVVVTTAAPPPTTQQTTLVPTEATICELECLNGNCVLDGRESSCECDDGYEESRGTSTCIDVNECLITDICDQYCSNIPGSYECYCDAGYTLNTTDLSTCMEIDECDSNPCVFGTCTDIVNGYRCTCDAGYQGIRCDTEINECASNPCDFGTCNDYVNAYNCTCLDGYTGVNCDEEIDECSDSPCLYGDCVDLVNNFRCDCASGWTGTLCDEDIDECQSSSLNNCEQICVNLNTTVDERGYTCDCNAGYELNSDETTCADIDECIGNPCLNGGTCENLVNAFQCTCDDGWEGSTCSQDIDECTLGTNECDVNAVCENTEGSYNCTCNEGYRGDGFVCLEIIMFDFGPEYGDVDLRDTREEKRSYGTFDFVSPTLQPTVGFPFWGEFYYSLYFTDNGIVVFTEENGDKYPFSYPPENGFTAAQTTPMIAVFWDDNDMSDEQYGNVYYKVYDTTETLSSTDSAIVDEINDRIRTTYPTAASPDSQFSDFEASWILKITWYRVPAVNVQYTKNSPNTFQGVLVTDGLHGFVIINYMEDEMLWDYTVRGDDVNRAIIGYNSGKGLASQIMNAQDQFASVDELYRPDQHLGNTGLQGRWVFRVEGNDDTTVNAKGRCLDWYLAQPDPSSWDTGLGVCPCSIDQATGDPAFGRGGRINGELESVALGDIYIQQQADLSLLGSISNITGVGTCLVSSFDNSDSAGQLCCYRDDGSLVEGYQSLWSSTFMQRHPWTNQAGSFDAVSYLQWIDDDVLARYFCCTMSSDPAFCNMYIEKRPEGSCDGYIPPETGFMLGDPHITTLDGVTYTFNGLGEYTLVEVDEGFFVLQARTARAETSDGGLSMATIFSAFAMKQNGTSTVQFTLNADGTDCDVLVDGNAFDKSILTEDLLTSSDFDGVGFYLQTETNRTRTAVVFSSGIGVSIGLSEGMLDADFSASTLYKGQTLGLLGVWNDDPADDFQLPGGSLQQPSVPGQNLTEEDYFDFGQAWQITAEESLFTYEGSDTWATYNNNTFVPLFLDAVLAASDSAFVATARQLCVDDTQCLFDTLATKNTLVGTATKSGTQKFQSDATNIANFPPEISVIRLINATVGEEVVVEVQASDPEGGLVTLSLGSSIEGAAIYANGTFVWTPTSTSTVRIGYVATDGVAQSVVEAVVRICDCRNGGVCDFEGVTEGSDVVNDKFTIVPCICSPAYTGDFCQDDYNGCDDDPCYPGVLCYDKTAPEIGAECRRCPSGLVGNGYKCYDFDECFEERDYYNGTFCDQICINTHGSYECSCNSGYTQHPDGKRCTDVNECNLNTDDCDAMATCTNEDGGYSCTCRVGYDDVSGDGTVCENINECDVDAPCNVNAECEDTPGSYVCTCNTGYEGTGLACADIDECATFSDDCDIQATCTNTIGSYTCRCNAGWEGDGKSCNNINECDLNTDQCSSKATCRDVVGSYSCACNAGYTGNGLTCNDIDECSTNQHGCASGTARCINTDGDYECECKTGYGGNGFNCTDIDECDDGSSMCSAFATCTNTEGSYKCECLDGYAGNGIVCSDIDECSTSRLNDCDLQSGFCLNTIGAYQCRCSRGYRGDGTNCTDVNECSDNDGGCEHDLCENSIGGFQCSCRAGYLLNEDGLTCDAINQCNLGTDDCPQGCTNGTATQYDCYCFQGFEDDGSGGCQPITSCSKSCTNGVCYVLNTVETCQCLRGYKLAVGSDTQCVDIDESTDADYPHRCEQIVTNTVPGYNCSCNEGFELNVDLRTCSDTNECQLETDVCDEHEICVNRYGSYQCVCDNGFYNSSGSCLDIDECSDYQLHGCSFNGYCNNTIGSYYCQCNDGYAGNGGVCVDINECSDDSSCDSNAECVNTEGGYNCTCISGFRGDGFTCTDIDECSESLDDCNADATCTNTDGSYLCACNSGFQGDGKSCFDVDECTLPDGDSRKHDCDVMATCNNTVGGYDCTCIEGYEGDGTQCADIDECASAADNTCDGNSLCQNIDRSYTCVCLSGYRAQSRDTCVDIDECAENPLICDENAGCSNAPGTYSCTCLQGYEGNGTVCSDVDECSSSDLNNCDPVAECNNYDGGYSCACPSGYLTINSTNGDVCEDFDECLYEKDECDADVGICTNVDGGYFCECEEGYSGNGVVCTDIDECKNKPCNYNNNERCINTPGNYECECLTGYVRNNGACEAIESLEASVVYVGSDGFEWRYTSALASRGTPTFQEYAAVVVQDMDAVFGNSSLEDQFVQTSVLSMEDYTSQVKVIFALGFLPGSAVNESAVEAAFLSHLQGSDVVNGRSRVVVDSFRVGVAVENPCEDQTDDCDPLATCVFISEGNYTCECDSGFEGSGTTGNCADINECEVDADICGSDLLECINTEGSYGCQCQSQYFLLDSENITCVERRALLMSTTLSSEVYTASLADKTSSAYIALSVRFKEVIVYMLTRSLITKDTFYGVGAITFFEGSVVGNADVLFSSDSSVSADDIGAVVNSYGNGDDDLAVITSGAVQMTFNLTTLAVTDYDPCTTCSANATCLVANGNATCQCNEGFEDVSTGSPGTDCIVPMATTETAASTMSTGTTVSPEECSADYCLNGGTCSLDSDGNRQCRCPERYEGDRCSTDLGSPDDSDFIEVIAIVGGVVGGIFLIAIVVCVMYCCVVCGRSKPERPRESMFIRNPYVGKYPEGFVRDSRGSDEIAWETVSSGQSSAGRPDEIEEMERMNTLASVMERAPMLNERIRERLRSFDVRSIRQAAALPQRSSEFITPYVASGVEATEREMQRRQMASRRGHRRSSRRDEGVLIPRARNEGNPTHHVPFSQLRDSSSNSETQSVSDFSMY